jgi:hypothetical protein
MCSLDCESAHNKKKMYLFWWVISIEHSPQAYAMSFPMGVTHIKIKF